LGSVENSVEHAEKRKGRAQRGGGPKNFFRGHGRPNRTSRIANCGKKKSTLQKK